MEPVGEHRELGGGDGWGDAMKILGQMEREIGDGHPPGDLSDRCAVAGTPDLSHSNRLPAADRLVLEHSST